MRELRGLPFIACVALGVWYALRNVRAALRDPRSRDGARGALLGAVIGGFPGGR